jgi:hypothetical protein
LIHRVGKAHLGALVQCLSAPQSNRLIVML